MRVNLGQAGSGDFFGRKDLVNRLLTDLQTTSVRLEDVRRVGKTWIVKELVRNSSDDLNIVYVDVEGVTSPTEFYIRAYGAISQSLPKKKQAQERALGFLKKVEGVQVGPLKIPTVQQDDWTSRLESLVAGYIDCFDMGVVVLAFDELPWAVDAIADRDPGQAEQLLGLLRSLRSRHQKLRMIYCGSIGFHHVLRRLVNRGFTSDPLSGMQSISVGPMTLSDAQGLVEFLMVGEGIYGAEGQEIESKIAVIAGQFPFYIQQVVSHLVRKPKTNSGITESDIEQAFGEMLNSPEENFRFNEYESRLVAHHGDALARACSKILDTVALHPPEISRNELEDQLSVDPDLQEAAFRAGGQSRFSRPDFVEAYRILERDRYLTRNAQENISFSFELFRLAWIRMRLL